MVDTDNNLNKESLLEREENLKEKSGVTQAVLSQPVEKASKNTGAEGMDPVRNSTFRQNQINNNADALKEEISNGMEKFEEMFKAGVHFGYSKSKRHSKMAPYIYGIKNNVEIFDLEKTEKCAESALDFLKTAFQEKKTILFVGTKPGIKDIIKKIAKEKEMPYVVNRWLGGLLTNFKAVRGRVLNFENLKKDIESNSLHKYTKKERVKINKEFERMERKFSGLESLTALPDVLFVIDPKEESTAVREAKRLSIPVVAIMSNDCDPANITYLIPANDAAPKSVEYIINMLFPA